MKILALDTSRKMSEVSVFETETNFLVTEMCMEKNNESLLLMIRKALQNANMRLQEIDVFGGCIGPGSFTGLRIGLTTLKTFSQIMDKPVAGMNTFHAMALTADFSGMVCIDARGGRVYYDEVDKTKGPKHGAKTGQLTGLLEQGIQEPVLYLHSEKIEKTFADFGIKAISLPEDIALTPQIVKFAAENAKRHLVGRWENLMPEYVGVSQAERELERKQCRR